MQSSRHFISYGVGPTHPSRVPQGNRARPTRYEIEYGPATLGRKYRRAIYVQVCGRPPVVVPVNHIRLK